MKPVRGLWLLAFLTSLVAVASGSPDSLREQYRQENNPKTQLSILNQIGEYFLFLNFDSAYKYFDQVYRLAFEKEKNSRDKEEEIAFKRIRATAFMNKIVANDVYGNPERVLEMVDDLYRMGSELGDTMFMIRSRLSAGNAKNFQGNYPGAIESYTEALKFSEMIQSELHLAKANQNLGIVFFYQGNNARSAFHTGEAVRIYTDLGNLLGKASCLLMLGNLVSEVGQHERAIAYYQEAYEGFEEVNHTEGKFNALLNIGATLHEQGLYREAIQQYNLAKEVAEATNDLMGLSRCLHNIGLSYMSLNQPNQALDYFRQALDIATENNFAHLQAHTTGSMAGALNDLRRFDQAYRHALRSLALAREIQSVSMMSTAYRNLWRAQEGLGNFRRALEYHKSFKLYNDSLTNINTQVEINRMELQFQNERLQDQMTRQNAELESQKAELLRQSTSIRLKRTENLLLITGSGALFFILILVSISWRRRKKINELILSQKIKIEYINEQLVSQNKNISTQRDEIERQKFIIEENNKTLVSSIQYAQSIQKTLLPSNNKLMDYLGDHFLIFEPKAIVSGDFYWVGKHNDQTILALADSAGHGVPGAFLSVLGISFLNEYLYNHNIHTPAQILNEFRTYIINSLNQNRNGHTVHEGIELALVAINNVNRSIVFSGARTPLLIASRDAVTVNNKQVFPENGSLIKVKPDAWALSYQDKLEAYHDLEIVAGAGSMIYVVTDGFTDQFRHLSNERFTSQRLYAILSEIFELPTETQKQVLQDVFQTWKQQNEQIDDVAMIGIRI
ncbi:MAG TPA: tetratricopeptide repeat protein [Bacteroidales bacterium]|nr:tetratricopeptide repeat protein [Bacteroidales bacterium]